MKFSPAFISRVADLVYVGDKAHPGDIELPARPEDGKDYRWDIALGQWVEIPPVLESPVSTGVSSVLPILAEIDSRLAILEKRAPRTEQELLDIAKAKG